MSFAVAAIQQQQLSARRYVEVREAPGRTSLGAHLSISGVTLHAQSEQSVEGAASESSSLRDSDSYGPKTILSAPILYWSASLERRFAHAAARIATGKATKEERGKFAELQNSRRRVHLARPGKDVLHDFEERQRTADLVRALQRYVEFASY